MMSKTEFSQELSLKSSALFKALVVRFSRSYVKFLIYSQVHSKILTLIQFQRSQQFKQYKKALKIAEQILKSNPTHGGTKSFY